jgi:lactoylglutathione lyase
MGVGDSNSVSYPRTFHLGFIRPSEAEVNEINQRLNEDGFDVEAPSHQHGAWSFTFQAPGDFAVVVRVPDKRHG